MLILGCSETCPASEVYSQNLVYFLFLLDFILVDIGRDIDIVTVRKIEKLPVCHLVIRIPINLIKSIDLETAFDSLKLYLISRQYLMCHTILLEVDTRKLRYELERTDLVSSFLPCRENPQIVLDLLLYRLSYGLGKISVFRLDIISILVLMDYRFWFRVIAGNRRRCQDRVVAPFPFDKEHPQFFSLIDGKLIGLDLHLEYTADLAPPLFIGCSLRICYSCILIQSVVHTL